MPVCPQCDNRHFSNKEALLQHIKSSSAWHPFCDICERRFTSSAAFEAHMEAKHPPTYDCTSCARSYHALFALEDHYRGSAAHPNCAVCGRGFKDSAANEEHYASAHPRVPCVQCGGRLIYQEGIEQHYKESSNHPSCTHCGLGFKDESACEDHVASAHPELRCETCRKQFDNAQMANIHFLTSSTHPKCMDCTLGFQDDQKYSEHMQSVHLPKQSPPMDTDASYNTGFTPLSPSNAAKELIAGRRRIDSPALTLQMNFSSPIQEVQPVFSPVGLPRPGKIVDDLWSSRDNIQIPRSQIPAILSEKTDERSFPTISTSPPLNTRQAYVPGQFNRRRSDSDTLIEEAFSPVAAEPEPTKSEISARWPLESPPKSFTTYSSRSRDLVSFKRQTPLEISEFDPRLYPGSVRAAARSGMSPPMRSPYISGSSYRSQSTHSVSSFGTRALFDQLPGGSRSPPSEHLVDWNSLLGETEPLKFDTSSIFSEVPTPRVETPASNPLKFSPNSDLNSISSVTSSAPGLSPAMTYEHFESRPTTAASVNTLPLQVPAFNITSSSSEFGCSETSRSPDVASPDGLAILPQISPLPSTPSDIPGIDIPEALRPLPDSLPPSPETAFVQNHTDSEESREIPIRADSDDTEIISPSGLEEQDTQTTIVEALDIPQRTPQKFHCRICNLSTCNDITATMCGHIFCYKCITEHVIQSSQCAVCSTPTLLYCLFRLHLDT